MILRNLVVITHAYGYAVIGTIVGDSSWICKHDNFQTLGNEKKSNIWSPLLAWSPTQTKSKKKKKNLFMHKAGYFLGPCSHPNCEGYMMFQYHSIKPNASSFNHVDNPKF